MKPKVFGVRISKEEAEDDSGNVIIKAGAIVEYSTEALGDGRQVFETCGESIPYNLDDASEDVLIEFQIEELKKILELFGVDVTEWDEAVKLAWYAYEK